MSRYPVECPEWGPYDTHHYQDEDDGHTLAHCACGAPNPNFLDEPISRPASGLSGLFPADPPF